MTEKNLRNPLKKTKVEIRSRYQDLREDLQIEFVRKKVLREEAVELAEYKLELTKSWMRLKLKKTLAAKPSII